MKQRCCPNCGSTVFLDYPERMIRKCRSCLNEYPLDDKSKGFDGDIETAIKLRNELEFDDAIEKLEQLLRDNPDSAELLYQYLLAYHGVSFVSEEGKINETPTLNRLSEQSIFVHPYYQKLKYMAGGAPSLLPSLEMLDKIEELRKKAMELMAKQEPYDIFICYKKTDGELLTQDYVTASKLHRKFTDIGYKVFLAEECIQPGDDYEPIIYGALSTAKVMFVVAATPNKPEYLNAKWVRNEWSRFAHRIDNDGADALIIPVLDNGFKPELLPRRLGKAQAIKLDDEFDGKVLALFNSIFVGKKLNGIKTKIVERNIATLSVERQTISAVSLQHAASRSLSLSESTELDFAVDEMKAGNFEEAYDRLNKIIHRNPHNYEANLCKLCCDFCVLDEKELITRDLSQAIRNTIRSDLEFTLSVASEEQRGNLIYIFNTILVNTFKKSLYVYYEELKEDGLVLLLYSLMDNAQRLTNIAKLKELFLLQVKNREIRSDKCKLMIESLFRRIYSNYGGNGARMLVDLYLDYAELAADIYSVEEALKIDPNNIRALFLRYLVGGVGENSGDYIASLKRNLRYNRLVFEKYDVQEHEIKRMNNNLYSLFVDLMAVGCTISGSSEIADPYISVGNSVLRYFFYDLGADGFFDYNIQSQIVESLAELSDPKTLKEKSTCDRFRSLAKELLRHEKIEFARRFFEQCLIGNEYDLEARWGLFMIELGFTNIYEFFLLDQKLSDIPSFITIVELSKEAGMNSNNDVLRQFYSFLEGFKKNAKLNKADVIQCVTILKQRLINPPITQFNTTLYPDYNPFTQIHSEIHRAEESLRKQNIINSAQELQKADVIRKRLKNGQAICIISVIMSLFIGASAIIFKPEITLGISFLLLLIFGIIIKFAPISYHTIRKFDFYSLFRNIIVFVGFYVYCIQTLKEHADMFKSLLIAMPIFFITFALLERLIAKTPTDAIKNDYAFYVGMSASMLLLRINYMHASDINNDSFWQSFRGVLYSDGVLALLIGVILFIALFFIFIIIYKRSKYQQHVEDQIYVIIKLWDQR